MTEEYGWPMTVYETFTNNVRAEDAYSSYLPTGYAVNFVFYLVLSSALKASLLKIRTARRRSPVPKNGS